MSKKAANSNHQFLNGTILPFQIENVDVTGRFLRSEKTITEVLERHAYPESVARLLGEALIILALIGSGMKLRHRLILQIQGDGALPMLIAEYTAEGTMRGYVDIKQEMYEKWTGGENINPFLLFGKGHIAITIDQGAGMQPYQGIIALEGESLSASVMHYFEQSQQIISSLQIFLEHFLEDGKRFWRAGGILLQKLGRAGEDLKAAALDETQKDNWDRCCALLKTATSKETLDPNLKDTELLYRLFHEDGVRIFDASDLGFACSCSRERLESFLRGNSPEALQEMVEDDGHIHANCKFCNAKYSFTPQELTDT